jgi:hypothetical protein
VICGPGCQHPHWKNWMLNSCIIPAQWTPLIVIGIIGRKTINISIGRMKSSLHLLGPTWTSLGRQTICDCPYPRHLCLNVNVCMEDVHLRSWGCLGQVSRPCAKFKCFA